jgi:hypothetical protein
MRTPLFAAFVVAALAASARADDWDDGPGALARLPRLTEDQGREAMELAQLRLARRLAVVDARLWDARACLERAAAGLKADPAALKWRGEVRDASRILAEAGDRAVESVADFRARLTELRREGVAWDVLRPARLDLAEPLQALLREELVEMAQALLVLRQAVECEPAKAAERVGALQRRTERLKSRLSDFPPLQYARLIVLLERLDDDVKGRYAELARIRPHPLTSGLPDPFR